MNAKMNFLPVMFQNSLIRRRSPKVGCLLAMIAVVAVILGGIDQHVPAGVEGSGRSQQHHSSFVTQTTSIRSNRQRSVPEHNTLQTSTTVRRGGGPRYEQRSSSKPPTTTTREFCSTYVKLIMTTINAY
jgi:hypothetical protein